jgi:hypothetical protein
VQPIEGEGLEIHFLPQKAQRSQRKMPPFGSGLCGSYALCGKTIVVFVYAQNRRGRGTIVAWRNNHLMKLL